MYLLSLFLKKFKEDFYIKFFYYIFMGVYVGLIKIKNKTVIIKKKKRQKKRENRNMKLIEKQVIAALSIAIIVVAVVFVYCFVTEMVLSSDNNQKVNSVHEEVQDSDHSSEGTSSNNTQASSQSTTTAITTTEEATTTTAPSTTTTEETITKSSTTREKEKSNQSIMDATDGYLFPYADSSYIDESDLNKMSTEEIQYAINEVYARHGLKFTKKKNKERFEKKKWYSARVNDQDSISLNAYEKKNVNTMAKVLEQRGVR